MGAEKVHAVDSQCKTPTHDVSDSDEGNYLDDQVISFKVKGQGSNKDTWYQGQKNHGRNY